MHNTASMNDWSELPSFMYLSAAVCRVSTGPGEEKPFQIVFFDKKEDFPAFSGISFTRIAQYEVTQRPPRKQFILEPSLAKSNSVNSRDAGNFKSKLANNH